MTDGTLYQVWEPLPDGIYELSLTFDCPDKAAEWAKTFVGSGARIVEVQTLICL